MRHQILSLTVLVVHCLATSQATTRTIDPERAMFDPLVPYNPQDLDAKFAADLALDLDAMRTLMKGREDIDAAYDIYKKGGYSQTTARLTLQAPMPFEIPRGEHIEGQASDGKHIKLASLVHVHPGVLQIDVVYTEPGHKCTFGALTDDKEQREGCLLESGYLQVGNHLSPLQYSYDPETDSSSGLSFHHLSAHADEYFSKNRNSNHGFYGFFTLYESYYGSEDVDFANKIIEAAVKGHKTKFHEGHHDELVFDFSNADEKTRSDSIGLLSAYVVVGMNMMRSLEEALLTCNGICWYDEGRDCDYSSINSLDTAMAFYTGSMQTHDNLDGNFLYYYANHLCKHTKTCGENGDQTEGTAKINYRIFSLFNQMKDSLEHLDCGAGGEIKREIQKQLDTLYFQAFHYTTYKMNNPSDSPKSSRDAAFVTTALFPILHHCEMIEVWRKEFNFEWGNKALKEKFNDIRQEIDDVYECAEVCCADVGGVWDSKAGDYHSTYAPCIDTSDECLAKMVSPVVADSGKGGKAWIVVGVLAALLIAMFLYQRRRSKRAAKIQKQSQPQASVVIRDFT